ncbi:O-Antigen ligase [compost metagenome]
MLAVYISVFNQGMTIFNKDTSFSSRNLIWGFVLQKSLANPFGYGISQFQNYLTGRDTSLFYSVGFSVAHSHNGFIEILYATGIIGLFLSIASLLSTLKDSILHINFRLNVFAITSIVIINTFEARFISFDFGFFVICFVTCFSKKILNLLKSSSSSSNKKSFDLSIPQLQDKNSQ